ncbi:MAG: ASCH domain-containing protein [Hyphomonadaceae bacterium]|jgi:hypothetical protein|nr:ASCH domain-containing protein [Hyphomonadaceae bacterium]
MHALSIRPAWAWTIIHGGKDVENRSRRTRFRGRFLVHASLTIRQSDFERAMQALCAAGERAILPREDEFASGGFIGSVELVDVAERCDSVWYAPGCVAWLLRNPRPLAFFPYRGRRSWFHVPDDLIPVSHRL